MKKAKGRVLLRGRINKPIMYRAAKPLFAVMLLCALVLALFFNVDSTKALSWQWLLPSVCFAAGLLFIPFWFMLQAKSVGKVKELVVALVLFSLLLVVLGFSAWQLRTQTGGAYFGEVYTAAANYANGGTLPGSYIALNPQFDAVFVLLCGYFFLFSLAGVSNFTLPFLGLNIAFLFAAVLLSYFVAKRLFMANKALLFLLVAVVFSPFLWLQASLLQGGTVAMAFVAGSVLLWLQIRKLWRGGAFGKSCLLFCVLSFLLALGTLFQAVVAALFVAIVLDLFLLLCGKGRILLFLSGGAVFLFVVFGGQMAMDASPVLAHYTESERMPPAAEIMVGLSPWGMENAQDSQKLQEALDYTARQDLIFEEIQMRLEDLGALGVMQLIGTKISVFFSEGTLGASASLEYEVVQEEGILQSLVLPTGALYSIFAYVAFALWGTLLLYGVVASVYSIIHKNDALTFMRVALLLAVVAGLFGVARPQFLIAVLPLFLLTTLEVGNAVQHKRVGQNTETDLRQDVEEEVFLELTQQEQHIDYMDPAFRWDEQDRTEVKTR